MKILVLTGFCGDKYSIVGPITAKNKEEYAKKHGYEFLCFNYNGYTDPVSWYKIEWIIKNLKNYDYIFWTDADALITNPEIRIEDLINKKSLRPKTIFVSPEAVPLEIEIPELKEANYIICHNKYSPCMGHFIIKNCDWSILFFSKILEMKQRYLHDPIWDNRPQDFLLFTTPQIAANIKFVEERDMNSGIHVWEPGDFILHYYASTKTSLTTYIKESIIDPMITKKRFS